MRKTSPQNCAIKVQKKIIQDQSRNMDLKAYEIFQNLREREGFSVVYQMTMKWVYGR